MTISKTVTSLLISGIILLFICIVILWPDATLPKTLIYTYTFDPNTIIKDFDDSNDVYVAYTIPITFDGDTNIYSIESFGLIKGSINVGLMYCIDPLYTINPGNGKTKFISSIKYIEEGFLWFNKLSYSPDHKYTVYNIKPKITFSFMKFKDMKYTGTWTFKFYKINKDEL